MAATAVAAPPALPGGTSPAGMNDWVEHEDPATKRKYWYSASRKESSWTRPPSAAAPPAAPVASVARSVSPSPASTVNDWVEHEDPTTKRKYWYSASRKESTWTKPAALAAPATASSAIKAPVAPVPAAPSGVNDWVEHEDPTSKKKYWYSASRKESTWTKPAALESASSSSAASSVAKAPVAPVAPAAPVPAAPQGANDWVEHEDPTSKRKYWYSASRKESTWTKPASLSTPSAACPVAPKAPVPAPAATGPAAPQGVNDWVEHEDPTSKRKYWYSASRKESTWTKPAALSTSSSAASSISPVAPAAKPPAAAPSHDWVEHEDPATKKKYWYSAKLGKSTWTKPDELSKPSAPLPAAPALPSSSFLSRPASATAAVPSPAAQSDWVEHEDPATKQKYWYNAKLNKSQWTKPEELTKPATPLGPVPPPASSASAVPLPGRAPSSTSASAPAQPASDWVEHEDPTTKKKYWYNAKLNKSQWTKPEELSKPAAPAPTPAASDWAEHEDPASRKKYWYNAKTGKSQWTKPDELNKPATPLPLTPPGPAPLGSSAALPRPSSVAAAAGPAAPSGSSDWVEHEDPTTKRKYWYNAKLNKSQWTKPEELNKPAVPLPAPTPPVPAASSSLSRAGSLSAPSGPAAPPPSDWTEQEDPTTRKKYWYNAKTGKSQWTKPEELNKPAAPLPALPPGPAIPTAVSSAPRPAAPAPVTPATSSDWAEHEDPTTKKKYWYNAKLNKSQWTKPEELNKPAAPLPAAPALPSSSSSRPATALASASSSAASDWAEHEDPTTKKKYWYNAKLNKSQWTQPEELNKPATPLPPTPPGPAAIAPLAASRPASSIAPVAPAATSDWTEQEDPATRQKYWYNAKLNKSQWTKPEELNKPAVPLPPTPPGPAAPALPAAPAAPSDWVEHEDPTTKKKYWYNAKLNKSQWTKPDELNKPASSLPSPPSAASSSASSSLSRPGSVVAPPGAAPASDWTEQEDPTTKRKYWYNPKTGKSQWTKPDELSKPAAPLPPSLPASSPSLPSSLSRSATPSAATPPVPSDWTEQEDPITKRKYWYNAKAGKSQWTKPEELNRPVAPTPPPTPGFGAAPAGPAPVGPAPLGPAPGPPSFGALPPTPAAPTPPAAPAAPAAPQPPDASDWVEMEDPVTRRKYYYSALQRRSTWTDPRGT